MKKIIFILILILVGCSQPELDELIKKAYAEDVKNAKFDLERFENILKPLSEYHDKEKVMPVFIREMDSVNSQNARFAARWVMEYKEEDAVKEKYLELLKEPEKVDYMVYKEIVPNSIKFDDPVFIPVLVKNIGLDEGNLVGGEGSQKAFMQMVTFEVLMKFAQEYGTEEVGDVVVKELKSTKNFTEEKMKVMGLLFLLGELKNEKYIETLKTYAEHEEGWVRAFAISSLTTFNNKKLVPVFNGKLYDEDASVVHEAISGLIGIGDNRVNPNLMRVITNTQFTSASEFAAYAVNVSMPYNFSILKGKDKLADYLIYLKNEFGYNYNYHDFLYYKNLISRDYLEELKIIKSHMPPAYGLELKDYYTLYYVDFSSQKENEQMKEKVIEKLKSAEYWGTKENEFPIVNRLSPVEVFKVKKIMEILEKKQYRDAIGELIKEDIKDNITEHGGIVYLNGENLMIKPFEPAQIDKYLEGEVSADNVYYVNSEKLMDEMAFSFASYHLHATEYNMDMQERLPSPNDMNTRVRLNNEDIIFTSIEKEKFSVTLHTADNYIIDLGEYSYEMD